jgi:D-alanyl-lipoteichoic acid acyltransferase DltB (MBOAT superfamily)
MLFNSPVFAVFFPIVLAIYWAAARHHRAQNLILVVASYIFYGWWDVRFLYLAILSSIIDFFCGLMIDGGKVGPRLRALGSAILLVSAFFLVTVDWHAVSVSWPSRYGPPAVAIDRARVLANPVGRGVFLATAAAVVIANLAYPWLSRLPDSIRRRLFITSSVTAQLTILGFFKYFNFFARSFAALVHAAFGSEPDFLTLNVILPVGISFYTFQTMSYTIDVYRRELPACRSLLDFSAFVAFFPQLVAGPIERAGHMLPQFRRERSIDWLDVREGAWLIAWGLYKKMVVADNMAAFVGQVFGPYDHAASAHVAAPHDGLRLLMGVYAFALQIYGDFSGYTDIARGTARLLGFRIMLNFNQPYFATSPSSFWRRWHISLSSWLRDYLYISLGGNRGGPLMIYRNLMLTMILGGLWHGASWTFVLWGTYQGLLLVAYRALGIRTERGGYPRWLLGLMGLLMFHLTCLGWLLFRAQNMTTVRVFLEGIFLHPHWSAGAAEVGGGILYYGGFLAAYEAVQGLMGGTDPMSRWPWFVRLNVWLFVLESLLVLTPSSPQTFIYFAF